MKEEVIAEKTSARQSKDKLWLIIRSWKTVLLGLVLAPFGVLLAGDGIAMLVLEGEMPRGPRLDFIFAGAGLVLVGILLALLRKGFVFDLARRQMTKSWSVGFLGRRLPLFRSGRSLFGLRGIVVAKMHVGQGHWSKTVFMVALQWPDTRIVVSEYSDMLNARLVANKISTFVDKPMIDG